MYQNAIKVQAKLNQQEIALKVESKFDSPPLHPNLILGRMDVDMDSDVCMNDVLFSDDLLRDQGLPTSGHPLLFAHPNICGEQGVHGNSGIYIRIAWIPLDPGHNGTHGNDGLQSYSREIHFSDMSINCLDTKTIIDTKTQASLIRYDSWGKLFQEVCNLYNRTYIAHVIVALPLCLLAYLAAYQTRQKVVAICKRHSFAMASQDKQRGTLALLQGGSLDEITGRGTLALLQGGSLDEITGHLTLLRIKVQLLLHTFMQAAVVSRF